MTEVTIQIDARHRAHRSGDRWLIQKANQDGVYDMIDQWAGNRRSLLKYLDDHNIHPTRTAEDQLAALPERQGFRDPK